jgi:hypothetical protein
LISEGKIFEISTAELYVWQAALRSSLGPFVQEILRKINSDHPAAWPDTYRRRQCRTAHTTADVEDVHPWGTR